MGGRPHGGRARGSGAGLATASVRVTPSRAAKAPARLRARHRSAAGCDGWYRGRVLFAACQQCRHAAGGTYQQCCPVGPGVWRCALDVNWCAWHARPKPPRHRATNVYKNARLGLMALPLRRGVWFMACAVRGCGRLPCAVQCSWPALRTGVYPPPSAGAARGPGYLRTFAWGLPVQRRGGTGGRVRCVGRGRSAPVRHV